MSDTKECSKCKSYHPLSDFTTRSRSGKKSISSWCKPCKRQISRDSRRDGRWNAPTDEKLEKWRLKNIADRQDPEKLARFIREDTRKSDKKRGLANDLSREQVANLISTGCSYCNAHDVRMTLDRIDNNIGHIMSNVVPACYRCNLIRGSMPYEAWVNIVPLIRDTYEKGMFGDWLTVPIARKVA